ncbi:Rpn family recombination-promoting nuclease/putative transposase [Flammeovirga aprica]|uniref:Rpn family recombination-promoting nuclease/putative transposase n=1 Tax=Flammeovirga aprica JL-4 TaxID=694437 RepID=A0A7X9RY68_9BACT|nr:Rpn family recombination-promoting nuclease/putative transposase [Flammeovirga aprica]NME70937.1 Rpn family recombination-promoting nuclease/putative transposase [Flammeovirga aprica JL-4]
MGNRNLIRFDWAMKRLLRNKADYSVLEGFLSELMKEDIKIESILESESNQQIEIDKYNRVDILVKNENGELVIIEVQNQLEHDYFQRMIYGTSKAVTEYITVGDSYKQVKKVYSVNIVYFDLGQGEDYVYHGRTHFEGIHQKDVLELSAKQKMLLGGKTTPSDLFPEYYVVKVNQFDDIARDTLDEWIYYFKNNEIKEDFKAKGLLQAKEILRVDNLSADEQAKYKIHLKNLRDEASRLFTLKAEAEFKVREDEARKKALEIAIESKKEGISLTTISKITGIPVEDLEKL